MYLPLAEGRVGRRMGVKKTDRFRDVTVAHRRHHEDPERGHDFIRICSNT